MSVFPFSTQLILVRRSFCLALFLTFIFSNACLAQSGIQNQIELPPLRPQAVTPETEAAEAPQEIYPSGLWPGLQALPLEAEAKPITLRAVLQKRQVLPLSLENALKLAEGQNITIQIAKENANIQRSDFYLRLSDLLPDITGDYRQSKLEGAVQVFGGDTVEVTRKTYQPQITLNYTVYTGGRNIFDIRSSKHRLNALEKQTQETRQDILRQVAIAYVDLQAAYWQRSISLQAIREAEQQVELTDARFQGGIGLQVDLLQARSNSSLRQQELVQAEQLISQSSENLGQLLNLDFQVDILPDTIDASIERLLPQDMTMDELLRIAEDNNPRLALLQEYAKAGRSDLKVAVADLFPQVTLTAYRNRTGPSPSEALPTRFTGIQASWNLLENMGFARPFQIKQARASAKLAEYNYDQGERLLKQSIANDWVSLNALEKNVVAARDGYNYSQAAYEQAAGRLQEGVGTNLELQLALTNLTRARSDLALTFLNYNRIQSNLLFNLGVLTPSTLLKGYQRQ
ncbi:MAG: TolC family protein [Vampirovibrionales bacterium]|nr:TolC family protein [Vampirovibrionales bacterium]